MPDQLGCTHHGAAAIATIVDVEAYSEGAIGWRGAVTSTFPTEGTAEAAVDSHLRQECQRAGCPALLLRSSDWLVFRPRTRSARVFGGGSALACRVRYYWSKRTREAGSSLGRESPCPRSARAT